MLSLAEQYGVGKSTIHDIKSSAANLKKFSAELDVACSSGCSTPRKTMRLPRDTQLDDAVNKWFLEQVESGEDVMEETLRAKALELNRDVEGDPSFKASVGWLKRFMSRHGVEVCDASNWTVFEAKQQMKLAKRKQRKLVKKVGCHEI